MFQPEEDDAIEVERFLLTGFPQLVVDRIVDFAEYWPCVSVAHDELYEGGSYGNDQILKTPAVPGSPRRVEFEVVSHDQGWCSDPNAGSWTWGEGVATAADGTIRTGRRHCVYRNNIADLQWQRHDATWQRDHPVLSEMEAGDSVELWIRSCFPGWRNFVNSAKLRVFYRTAG